MSDLRIPRIRIRNVLLFAMTSALSSTIATAPAAANDGTCGSGDLCLYQNRSLTGGRWDSAGNNVNYGSGHRWWGTTTSINDQASSARSRYSITNAFLYEHSYYRGDVLYIYPGEVVENLADYGFNDVASSNS